MTTPINNPHSLVPESDSLKSYYLNYQLSLLLTPYKLAILWSTIVISCHSYQGTLPPPGLTKDQHKQVTGDRPVQPDELEKVLIPSSLLSFPPPQMKVSIIHLLCCDQFKPNQVFVHLIGGSCDARHKLVITSGWSLSGNYTECKLSKI